MQELTTRPGIRQLLLAGFVIALTVVSWLVMSPFLVPVAWAAIISYASWPLYSKLLTLFGKRKQLAALAMTLGMAVAITLPIFWLFVTLKVELSAMAAAFSAKLSSGGFALPKFITDLPFIGSEIAAWFSQVVAAPAQLKTSIQTYLANANETAFAVLGGIGRNLAKMALALLTLFFVYRDGEKFLVQFECVLESMLGPRVRGYLAAAGGATRGVVYGILLTALVQGAVAGLGYWVAGLEAPLMLAALTVFVALIPFGTPFIWGSLGLWLLLTGQVWAGVGLLLWGGLVVSWVDNIVRPLVVSQNVKLPFILAFFGVLGGLAAFGLVGLFLGPVILAVAFAVWQEWLEAHPTSAIAEANVRKGLP